MKTRGPTRLDSRTEVCDYLHGPRPCRLSTLCGRKRLALAGSPGPRSLAARCESRPSKVIPVSWRL